MSITLKHRRGNTVSHSTFTGALAEITIDTDKNTVVVHNNSVAGGFPLAKESDVSIVVSHANAAFIQANTAIDNAVSASLYANAAFLQANAAFTAANNAVDTWVRDAANAASSYANSAYTQANTATTNAVTADNKAVTSGSYANAAFSQANTATTNAATADGKAVTAGSYANAAFLQANTGVTNAATADGKAVTSGNYANSAYTQANTATDNAVSAGLYANAAFLQANTATTNASVADGKAVTAGSYANSAFTKANNALPAAGGTITGSLTITNNLIVEGNTTFLGNSTVINTSTLELDDTLIYLGGNNYSSDAVSIGIIAHYNDVANAHAGIVRDPVLKEWLFFDGYTPEVQSNNLINIAHPSFSFANVYVDYLKGNVVANTVTVDGVDIFTFITNAYTQANTGVTNSLATSSYANSAFLKANTATNDAASASLYANAAFTAANNSIDTWVRGAANSASLYANAAYNQANTATADAQTANNNAASAALIAVTAGSYANSAYTQANTAIADADIADNKAVTSGSYANSAFLHANAAFEAANTGGGGGTPVSVTTDKFTANGSTSTFDLTVTPDNENLVTAVVDGIVQLRDTYILSGNIIQFDSTIYANANVEITTISGGGVDLSYANSAYSTANSGSSYANSAYIQANSAFSTANTATADATSAGSYANAAFTKANTGGGGSGLFNSAINVATGYAVTSALANAVVFTANATVHSIYITNIGADVSAAVTVTGDFTPTGSSANVSLFRNIPIPSRSSVEMLKKPQVVKENDIIKMQSFFNGVAASSNVHATIVYETTALSTFDREAKLANTGYSTLYTATGSPAVIESIKVVNQDTAFGNHAISIIWTNSANTIQGYMAKEIILPANSTIELCEAPKYMYTGDKLDIFSSLANVVSVFVSAKRTS